MFLRNQDINDIFNILFEMLEIIYDVILCFVVHFKRFMFFESYDIISVTFFILMADDDWLNETGTEAVRLLND